MSAEPGILESRRFTIHTIETRDIADIVEIAKECALSPWSVEDYSEEAHREDSTMIRLRTEEGETVAFLVGRRVPSSVKENEYSAELYNIGVKMEFRKKGCGTMLLREFLDKCRHGSVRHIWLDVRISNTGAIKFYKKFGFFEYTLRAGLYRDPVEDGIVMTLSM